MKHIAKGVLLPANLQDGYNFPSHIVCTDLCPDIVWWWDDCKTVVALLELTIPFNKLFGGGIFEEESQVCRARGIQKGLVQVQSDNDRSWVMWPN